MRTNCFPFLFADVAWRIVWFSSSQFCHADSCTADSPRIDTPQETRQNATKCTVKYHQQKKPLCPWGMNLPVSDQKQKIVLIKTVHCPWPMKFMMLSVFKENRKWLEIERKLLPNTPRITWSEVYQERHIRFLGFSPSLSSQYSKAFYVGNVLVPLAK